MMCLECKKNYMFCMVFYHVLHILIIVLILSTVSVNKILLKFIVHMSNLFYKIFYILLNY